VQVVSAHAATIGDSLLGVPLNCSAGLHADAVGLLQEAGLWGLAAALTARSLTGTERAQALSRWARHVREQEGSTWRCVGILTAAGCLQAAAQVGGGGGAGGGSVSVWEEARALEHVPQQLCVKS